MVSASAYDLFVRVAEIAAAFFAAVTLVLFAGLLALRASNDAAQRRFQRLERTWRGCLDGSVAVESLPGIRKRDRFDVLQIFNAARADAEATGAADAEYFDRAAGASGLRGYAAELLERGDDADKIVAVQLLGRLGDPAFVEPIRTAMRWGRGDTARAAAGALLRLDPASTTDVLIRVRDSRSWVGPRVERMLRTVEQHRLDAAMQAVLAESDDAGKLSLLEFLGCCSAETARSIALGVLQTPRDDELVAAALRGLAPVATAQDAAVARDYLGSPEPFVVLAALAVLKGVAGAGDGPALEALACDANWWVRHRAAECLVAVDGTGAMAKTFCGTTADPFARDAVAQALAQRVSA